MGSLDIYSEITEVLSTEQIGIQVADQSKGANGHSKGKKENTFLNRYTPVSNLEYPDWTT